MSPKSLSELCISGIKSSKYYVEILLMLPKSISRDICDSVIPINNHTTIMMTNAKYAKGISCGYDIRQKQFLFGEYGIDISSDMIRERVWSQSLQASEACKIITKCAQDLDLLKQKGENDQAAKREDMANNTNEPWREKYYKEMMYLYQQVARWIYKYNHFLGLEVCGELMNVVSSETIALPLRVI